MSFHQNEVLINGFLHINPSILALGERLTHVLKESPNLFSEMSQAAMELHEKFHEDPTQETTVLACKVVGLTMGAFLDANSESNPIYNEQFIGPRVLVSSALMVVVYMSAHELMYKHPAFRQFVRLCNGLGVPSTEAKSAMESLAKKVRRNVVVDPLDHYLTSDVAESA